MVNPQTESSKNLRLRVAAIERLAAMPQVVLELMQSLDDAHTDASRLAGIIQSDPALTSKVLSLANSAFYGFRERVSTIQRAVVAIGFQELQLLALGSGLSEVFKTKNTPPGFDMDGLWVHSLSVSWITQELSKLTRIGSSGEMLISGLLHDLGKLVLANHLHAELGLIEELLAQGTPYYEAEEILGIKHTQIGSWLAQQWELPQVLGAAIANHHNLDPIDPDYQTTSLVTLADQITKSMGIGLIHQAPESDLAKAMDAASLTADDVKKIAQKAKKQVPILVKAWEQINT